MSIELQFPSPTWAVFNCHVNNARERAEQAFKLKYGKACWKREIQPFRDFGIMSIFKVTPNSYIISFIRDICIIVNERKSRTEHTQVVEMVESWLPKK